MAFLYRSYILTLPVFAAAVMGAALPARAETVGMIEGFGGITRDDRPLAGSEDEFSGAGAGSLAFGEGYLAQIDLFGGRHRGDGTAAGAVHVGVPLGETAYVGAYASYSTIQTPDRGDVWRIGAELSVGSSSFRLNGVAGYEDTQQSTTYIATTATDDIFDDYGRGGQFFDMVDATFYPSDRAALSVGHRYIGGVHAAAAGAEFAVSDTVSLFGEGRYGEDSYRAVWAGIRISFGGGGAIKAARDGKLLPNRLEDEMFGMGNTRARRSVALPPPPPPPPPPSSGCGNCGGYCQ